jgi:dolichyl-phosphate-mannose-protein mannosyltransferase
MRLAAALVVLALVVRVVAAVASFGTPLAFDPRDYDRYARSIATGHGYPHPFAPYGGATAYRPPGFPALLGAVYAVRGGAHPPPDWRVYLSRYQPDQHQADAGRVAEALLGTAVVALTGLVAFQLWGRRAAIASLALAAIYPPLVIVGVSLFSEPLFIACVLAAVAAALRARAGPVHGLRWALLGGALAGLAWLTRSNGFTVLPALCLLVWTARPRLSRAALAMPAALLAGAVLVVAPWTIRNAFALHAFVPVSTEAGYTLAGTYNATSARSSAYAAGWIPAQDDPHDAALIRRARGDADLSSTMLRATFRYIRAHPLYVGKVAYCNTMRMIYLERLGCGRSGFGKRNFIDETGISGGAADLGVAGFAVLALLAIAGAATRAARAAPAALWLVPLFLGTAVLVVSGNRIRAPIEPFLIMLGGLALAQLPLPPRRRPAGG